MKDIPHQKGKYLIERLVAQGEHSTQDFKFLIPDANKIARTISAFANCNGGHLLIGVKDNGTIAGVRNEEDIYVVEQAAAQCCNPPQEVDFAAYNVGSGVTVIKASFAPAQRKPVLALDNDRRWKAFYRVADENILAHPLMVEVWRAKAGSNNSSSVFELTGVEQNLLALLSQAPMPLSVRDIAVRLHVTSSAAKQAIVRVASLGLAGFNYQGNGSFSLSVV